MKVHKIEAGAVVPLTALQQQAIDFIGTRMLEGSRVTLGEVQAELGITMDATAELLGQLERLGLVNAHPSGSPS